MDEPKPDKPPQDMGLPDTAAPPKGEAAAKSVLAAAPSGAAQTREAQMQVTHLMDEDQDATPFAEAGTKTEKTDTRKPAGAKPASAGRWRLWTPAVLLFLSICYLVAEIEFNMSLLDVAGSVRSDPAKMEDLQVFGRAVSASGCFLLVLGFFASSGFHVTPGRMRWFYYGVGLVSILPLMLIFSATLAGPDSVPIDPSGSDVMLALAPALGIGYGSAIGRGRNAFVNVVSIFLIVWPAVFLGQKLLIEQALIERTSWEQRVNARYVLMLRSILEDCTINLDDLALCDVEDEQDSVKSARIILGSMWMLSPERIRSDMEENKDRLVQSVAARGLWFSPREQYDNYIAKVADERRNIHHQMIDAYFVPYKKASDDYAQAISPEVLRAESEKAVAEIEKEIDRGWRQYQQGVREYKQQLSASGVNMLQQLAPYKDRLREYCATRNCPPVLRGKERGLIADAASDAEREFSRRSGGYTPDIQTRAEFIAAYPTQIRLRNRVQEYISNRLPHSGFILPANWFYEKESFQKAVEALLKQEVDRKWKEKAPKDMPPGLALQAFFDASGLPPLPPMEDLVMTPDAFFKKMIMPKYREILDKMLGDIENEKHLYANGEPLAEKGRDYARAVLIPAVALIISLLVVILTMMRWWNIMVRTVLAVLMRRRLMPAALRLPVQLVMAGVFLGLIVVVPRFMPNPYAGATYERYRDEALTRAPLTAQVLDWAIHTQPAVYRLGSPIRDMLDHLHEKPEAKTPATQVKNG